MTSPPLPEPTEPVRIAVALLTAGVGEDGFDITADIIESLTPDEKDEVMVALVALSRSFIETRLDPGESIEFVLRRMAKATFR